MVYPTVNIVTLMLLEKKSAMKLKHISLASFNSATCAELVSVLLKRPPEFLKYSPTLIKASCFIFWASLYHHYKECQLRDRSLFIAWGGGAEDLGGDHMVI